MISGLLAFTSTNAKIHPVRNTRSAALPSTLTSKSGRAQGENAVESKRHPVSLKQYRKMNGKWQFVPVVRDAKGTPDPRLILVDGQPVSSKGGTFYLDF